MLPKANAKYICRVFCFLLCTKIANAVKYVARGKFCEHETLSDSGTEKSSKWNSRKRAKECFISTNNSNY